MVIIRSIVITLFFIVCNLLYSNNVLSQQLTQKEHDYVIETIKERDPAVRQKKLEAFVLNKDELIRFIFLPVLGLTSIENKQYIAAKAYANEMLNKASKFPTHWNAGNAIHDGNMILGLLALKNNKIAEAKRYLIESSQAPSSPQLQVYGPHMILADALLDLGEKDVVLKYLNSLRTIWTENDGRIDSWIASINGGERPYFGLNLPFKFGQ